MPPTRQSQFSLATALSVPICLQLVLSARVVSSTSHYQPQRLRLACFLIANLPSVADHFFLSLKFLSFALPLPAGRSAIVSVILATIRPSETSALQLSTVSGPASSFGARCLHCTAVSECALLYLALPVFSTSRCVAAIVVLISTQHLDSHLCYAWLHSWP